MSPGIPNPMNGQARGPDDGHLPELSPDLLQLEQTLHGLAPRENRLDRDQILFAAGRESVVTATSSDKRIRWFWPTTAATMTAIAASLALMLALKSDVQVIERVKLVEVDRVPHPEGDLPRENANTGDQTAPDRLALPYEPSRQEELAWSWSVPTASDSPGGLVPRAGMDFRLFEHLIGESPQRVDSHELIPPKETERDVISPRSLPRLLDRSA